MRIAAAAALILVLGLRLRLAAQSSGGRSRRARGRASRPLRQPRPSPVPTPSEKALRYYRSGNVLWAIDTLWGLLVPALLLFTGISARMRDAARRIGRNWFFTLAVYGLLFTLVTALLDLPLA